LKQLNNTMAASNLNADYRLVEKNEMENFMERCMLAAGACSDHAKSLAACLIAADYQGNFSHGLNRLGNF
jgi:LDH2 family malate/lactate/ureidoglycolate dehydrogenase